MDKRTKRVWKGLVDYANATATSIDINQLRRTVADCMPWYLVAKWAPFGLGFLNRLDLVSEEAVKYQLSVRGLLHWFCSRIQTQDTSYDVIEALQFLHEHVDHIRWRLTEVPRPQDFLRELEQYYPHDDLERFAEESQEYWTGGKRGASPSGIQLPSKEYADLADPICDFLLTEYQKYCGTEYSRKDKKPPSLTPIFVCPTCCKLAVAERVGRRKYCPGCSDKARAKSYLEKASPNENRDYQWLYRLKDAKPELRKARLRQPRVKERLAEIMARQKSSARCQKLIHDMRLHVAPTNA